MAKYGALGCKPDPFDPRDHVFELRVPRAIGAIPPAIDLRNFCSAARDQGDLGACTGFALGTGLREFMQCKSGQPNPMIVVSPLFIYYQERKIEGTIDQDSGAYLRDGLKVLNDIGVCPEADCPYKPERFRRAPSKKAMADARQFRIQEYHRITTLFGLKEALASGHGCVLGISVYESFESDDVARTGRVPLPGPGEQLLGGHAVFCAGCQEDDSWDGGGYLIAKNSWGTDWGDKGWCYLPFDYIQPKLANDMWTATM